VYEDGSSGYIRREIESRGWKISVSEYMEEWDTDIEGDWDHDYGYDDLGGDSDLWRRARD
jgi:hypothetical protein